MNKPEYFICENVDICKSSGFCSHREKHEELLYCFKPCKALSAAVITGSTCISYDNYLAKKNKELLTPSVPLTPNILFQLSVQWSNDNITVSRHKTRKEAEAMVIEVIDASDDTAQNGYVTMIIITEIDRSVPNTTNSHQLY